MLHFDYSSWFSNFSPEMATFLIAMVPISELRAAIPIAIKIYHLPVWSAYTWSVLGNLVPMILIVLILQPIADFLSRHFRIFHKFFEWLFEHTRKRGAKKFEKWGELAVFILTATPIPLLGGWTGPLAAFVFNIKLKKSIPLIVLGCMTAGAIVTLITLFSTSGFS
ncbi:MAG: small multi-drug export protein [Candidatus Moranbacteria bacterium]|nr:small multi-drug export protein [Candidatus Moranbacteria bacterium]